MTFEKNIYFLVNGGYMLVNFYADDVTPFSIVSFFSE